MRVVPPDAMPGSAPNEPLAWLSMIDAAGKRGAVRGASGATKNVVAPDVGIG